LQILKIILIFSLLVLPFLGKSQTNTYRKELTVVTDNDAYVSMIRDQYYSNGILLNYKFLNDSIALFRSKSIKKQFTEIQFGHNIYTPEEYREFNLAELDRPYAGWIFGGLHYNVVKHKSFLKLKINAGVIGPKAMGDKFQKNWHKIFGFDQPNGWETQIQNEFNVNVGIDHSFLIAEDALSTERFEIFCNNSLTLGNGFSNISTGLTFRAGKANPIEESNLFGSKIGNGKSFDKVEFYFFYKPAVAFILYDATVQGGLFEHTSIVTFTPNRFVFGNELGLSFSYKQVSMEYSVFLKTAEISKNQAQFYGRILLAYRFRQ